MQILHLFAGLQPVNELPFGTPNLSKAEMKSSKSTLCKNADVAGGYFKFRADGNIVISAGICDISGVPDGNK